MVNRVIALVGLALILTVGASAIDSAYVSQGTPQSVDNETFVADNASEIVLDSSRLDGVEYNASVTVRNNGTVYAAAGNYSWDDQDGTLSVTKDGQLDNDTRKYANVSYGWVDTGEEAKQQAELLGNGIDAVGALTLIVGVGVVLMAARVLGGL